MRLRLAAAAVLLLCHGCASNPSTQAAAVREVDAKDVSRCALISNVRGKSLLTGGTSTNAANALVDAKEQAAGLGANVIVIQNVDPGTAYTTALAAVKAYRCN